MGFLPEDNFDDIEDGNESSGPLTPGRYDMKIFYVQEGSANTGTKFINVGLSCIKNRGADPVFQKLWFEKGNQGLSLAARRFLKVLSDMSDEPLSHTDDMKNMVVNAEVFVDSEYNGKEQLGVRWVKPSDVKVKKKEFEPSNENGEPESTQTPDDLPF